MSKIEQAFRGSVLKSGSRWQAKLTHGNAWAVTECDTHAEAVAALPALHAALTTVRRAVRGPAADRVQVAA